MRRPKPWRQATELAIGADLARLSDRELSEISAAVRALAAYRDPSQPERACDHCGQSYRGPALYCCLRCAVADANVV
jgi:hypothetical protein